MGAALSTVGTYAGLAAVTMERAQRVAPTAYAWGSLVIVLMVVGGLWALAQPTAGWPVAARLPARLALIALYPALLVALRVYRLDELRSLAAAAADRLRRGR
jgi:hypothetical protein